MLDWMASPRLRMESQAGLDKGEAHHALAQAVFAHSEDRSPSLCHRICMLRSAMTWLSVAKGQQDDDLTA